MRVFFLRDSLSIPASYFYNSVPTMKTGNLTTNLWTLGNVYYVRSRIPIKGHDDTMKDFATSFPVF